MSELKRLVGAGLFILLAGIIALGGWTALAPRSGREPDRLAARADP